MASGSGIDSDLLTDLGSRPTNALVVFELGIDGTKKYSEAWAASSTGLYEGYVIESGEIQRSVSDKSFKLPRDSASVVVVDDSTLTLEKAIMGSAVGSVSGATATIKIASTTRAQAKWFTLFSGIVDDFSSPSYRRWRFNLRRDDRQLQRINWIPYIQSDSWPNAPDASLGLPGKVVYGEHSSTGTAVTGMVSTIYVDSTNFVYYVSFGECASVDAVYVDGTLADTADYSIDTTYFTKGRYYTVIDFTSDQGDTAVVTCDVSGITDGGMIENPATQLEHFLNNFGVGFWGGAASGWLTSSTVGLIDEDFHADVETFLSDKQVAKGSRVIPSGRKNIDVLNEWCNQFQIHSFWTYDGKLAIRPDDHTDTDIYTAASHYRQQMSPEPETRDIVWDTDSLTDEISAEYIFSEADGAFQKQLTVKDESKGYDNPEALQLHWRESRAVG